MLAACAGPLHAQTSAAHPKQQQQEQEPPEEDESLKPKEYSFNPLQAQKEITVGNYYFKKHNFRAAARRFEEATRWNPNFPEAYLRLGEVEEKLHDDKAARAAYQKYIELVPNGKETDQIKKKLAGKS